MPSLFVGSVFKLQALQANNQVLRNRIFFSKFLPLVTIRFNRISNTLQLANQHQKVPDEFRPRVKKNSLFFATCRMEDPDLGNIIKELHKSVWIFRLKKGI